MSDRPKYTNVSLEPVESLGYISKPCMKSGFCCTQAPCPYGEWDSEKHKCKYLGDPNDIGQRDCGRYNWILENVPEEIRLYCPAFGAGCCMPIGNEARDAIIQTIKEKGIK